MDHRATLGIALAGLGGLIAVANAWSVIQSRRTGRFHSPVPLLGGVLLGAGAWLSAGPRWLAFVAPLLDYGTLAVLQALPRLARELWSTSAFNLLSEFRAESGPRTIRLRLFRRGVFTMRLEIRRGPSELGLTSAGSIGSWHRSASGLKLEMGKEVAIFENINDAAPCRLRHVSGFASWETDQDRTMVGLDFVEIHPSKPG